MGLCRERLEFTSANVTYLPHREIIDLYTIKIPRYILASFNENFNKINQNIDVIL